LREARILLIEDSNTDVFLIREALKEHHIEANISVAEDGAVARQLIDRENGCPDLVVLDLNLPQVNGLTLVQTMRERGWCSRTTVVVLTSSESQRDRDQALALGARQFLNKASSFDDFLAIGRVFKELLQEQMARS